MDIHQLSGKLTPDLIKSDNKTQLDLVDISAFQNVPFAEQENLESPKPPLSDLRNRPSENYRTVQNNYTSDIQQTYSSQTLENSLTNGHTADRYISTHLVSEKPPPSKGDPQNHERVRTMQGKHSFSFRRISLSPEQALDNKETSEKISLFNEGDSSTAMDLSESSKRESGNQSPSEYLWIPLKRNSSTDIDMVSESSEETSENQEPYEDLSDMVSESSEETPDNQEPYEDLSTLQGRYSLPAMGAISVNSKQVAGEPQTSEIFWDLQERLSSSVFNPVSTGPKHSTSGNQDLAENFGMWRKRSTSPTQATPSPKENPDKRKTFGSIWEPRKIVCAAVFGPACTKPKLVPVVSQTPQEAPDPAAIQPTRVGETSQPKPDHSRTHEGKPALHGGDDGARETGRVWTDTLEKDEDYWDEFFERKDEENKENTERPRSRSNSPVKIGSLVLQTIKKLAKVNKGTGSTGEEINQYIRNHCDRPAAHNTAEISNFLEDAFRIGTLVEASPGRFVLPEFVGTQTSANNTQGNPGASKKPKKKKKKKTKKGNGKKK